MNECIYRVHRMDVDDVLRRIGELGPIQLKLLVLFGLPHIWGGLILFSLNYAGKDPGWKCKSVAGRGGHVGVAVGNLTDPVAKCAYYEQGECIPEYSKEFTSIVTEVMIIIIIIINF